MQKYYIKFNSPEELEQAKQLAESMGYIYIDSKGKTNFLHLDDIGDYFIGDNRLEEDFIKNGYKEIKLFTEGEEVEVSDDGENWYKKIYLITIPGKSIYKYICVDEDSTDDYKNGKDYLHYSWKYIRKIQKLKTIKITTINGQEVEIEEQKLKDLGFSIK